MKLETSISSGLRITFLSLIYPGTVDDPSSNDWRTMMAKNLVVHNVEEDIVLALNERAAVRGRSAESEHREILRVDAHLKLTR